MSKAKMRVAILCNGNSSVVTDRVELIEALHHQNIQPYTVGIDDGAINPYYSEDTSIFVPIIASRSNTNPINEIKSIISVSKQMKRNKIDAAIIYGVKNHPAMAIGCRLGGVKKIMCIVNGSGNLFRIMGIKGKILRIMSFPTLHIAYSISNNIGFQNADDKALFLKKHLIGKQTNTFIMNGSGVNLDAFPKQAVPNDGSVLFLSRITPSKGLNEFIEAANIVQKKGLKVRFDIVGPLDSAIENNPNNKLQKAVADKIVYYHGETKDVSKWMGKCKLFIYPSYYPEGVPRCVLQAMSTGRAIVTCNTPGCKSTVQNGVNGFLVRPKNSVELANKIMYLLNNNQLLLQMSVASREIAEKYFDVNKINSLIISKLLN